MIRHIVTYLIVIMIALQSFVAMADSHQLHQSGTKHIVFEHQHDLDNVMPDDSANSMFDCHHCCHCHGMSHPFLVSGEDSVIAISLGNEVSDYQASYFLFRTPPDNPPPITQ